MIHGPLKRAWSTSETKCHDTKFVVSHVRLERSLMFFPGLEQYLMESCSQIQYGKPGSSKQFNQ